MINPDDRNAGLSNNNAANNSNMAATNLPNKCVCSWKHCRTYQKGFHDAQHPVLDGTIKLKFVKDHSASQALKDSIDRVLRVAPEKANDWKPGRKEGQYVIRYYVARHHYTEKHIQKFLADPKGFSFLKPFSVHGAKKYLFTVDPNETFQLPPAADGSKQQQEPLYLQCPNVPKEVVKAEYNRLRGADVTESSSPEQPLQQQQQPGPSVPQPASLKEKQQATTATPVVTSSNQPPKQSVGDKKDSLTVSTTRSSSQVAQHQLKSKEIENKKLKDELEMMKSQLTFLHDMVRKLQEEHFGGDSRSVYGGGGGMSVKSGRSRSVVSSRPGRGSGRSARSGVPREICMDDVDDAGDDWTEYQEDDTARHYDDDDDETDETTTTFQVTYKAQRRFSNNTQASRGGASIVSASRSVKTLPRELELDEDEDDSDSHESLEEEAFDNRSFASTVHSSRHSRGRRLYDDDEDEEDDNSSQYQSQQQQQQRGGFVGSSGRPRGGYGAASSQKNAMSNPAGGEQNQRQPKRRGSIGSQRSSRSQRSVSTSGAGTYEVKAMDVTDPYGEKGTYTGSISNSTGMPHGYGRLEYDRAGRWYEGDWKHGRWTGHGRLSNGDGDFYEGGLKNDHKHGQGMMKFADGRTFEGEYINGQMIEGRMTYQDGSTYSGSWVDGMRHGRGKCVFTDDSVYEGEFREGEFSGHGKMAWSDGGWYEGEWWNGEMHGKGKEIRPDGSVRHNGEWCKGQPIRH